MAAEVVRELLHVKTENEKVEAFVLENLELGDRYAQINIEDSWYDGVTLEIFNPKELEEIIGVLNKVLKELKK